MGAPGSDRDIPQIGDTSTPPPPPPEYTASRATAIAATRTTIRTQFLLERSLGGAFISQSPPAWDTIGRLPDASRRGTKSPDSRPKLRMLRRRGRAGCSRRQPQ